MLAPENNQRYFKRKVEYTWVVQKRVLVGGMVLERRRTPHFGNPTDICVARNKVEIVEVERYRYGIGDTLKNDVVGITGEHTRNITFALHFGTSR